MLDTELTKQILDNIKSQGATTNNIRININLADVVSYSSGSPRIQKTFSRKAVLIVSRPKNLETINQLEIRCALCKKPISYPAWYYHIKYAVNELHYFLCFDSESSNKPSAKCYRKDV